jgi:hypothetical protein
MKDDKKSIMQEALIDFKDIQEAAEANAKKKLAEEFPKEFSNILKEELNKNKKSAKESYKKLDEGKESEKSDNTESNKESVMKNQEKETKKVVETAGEGLPFKEKATVPSKDVAKLNEKAVDETAGEGLPFKEKATVPSKDVAKINEKAVDETAGEGLPFKEKATVPSKDVAKINEKAVDEDVHITDTVGKSNPFDKKSTIPSKDVAKINEKKVNEVARTKKPLQTEEFDITELDMQSVGNALESANENDDVLTMENIEEELSAMEGLGEELGASPSNMEQGNQGIAYNKLMEMRNQLDEMMASLGEGGMSEMHQGNFNPSTINKMHQGAYDSKLIDEKNVDEMHQGNFNPSTINKMHQGAYDSKLIDEEEPITDKDVEDVLGAPGEKPMEEAHTVSYSGRRTMAGRTLPGNKDYLSQGEQDQAPYATMHETQKRIIGLIKENKGLTKKFNEVKKYKDTVAPLLENYKIALDKYRNQLKEMAVFNTNLAHVNNLLVNEELALTQDDKIRIINEFKKVDNIADSQKKYKAVLTEMKESKKTLTESVEEKASVSIQPSSKQKLDEVTAYKDDAHINKMKKLIEYVERRDKKIIN